MPQLEIKLNENIIETVPMDSLKQAVEFVNDYPANHYGLNFTYLTPCNYFRIDNAVQITKAKPMNEFQSQVNLIQARINQIVHSDLYTDDVKEMLIAKENNFLEIIHTQRANDIIVVDAEIL